MRYSFIVFILNMFKKPLMIFLGIDYDGNNIIQCSGIGEEDLTPNIVEKDSENTTFTQEDKDSLKDQINAIGDVVSGLGGVAAGTMLTKAIVDTVVEPVNVPLDLTLTALIGVGTATTKIIQNKSIRFVDKQPIDSSVSEPPSPTIYEDSIPNLPLMLMDYLESLDENNKLIIYIVILLVGSYMLYKSIQWKNEFNKKINKRIESYGILMKGFIKIKNILNSYMNIFYYIMIIFFIAISIIGIIVLILERVI